MTFWAKFLIVVILVLSVIFAAISTVLFAKHQDYRNELVEQSAKYETYYNTAEGDKARLQNELVIKSDELARKQTELKASELQVDSLTAELTETKADVVEEQSRLAKAQDSVNTLTIGNQALAKANEKLLGENETVRKENVALTKSLADEQKVTNDLKGQVATLTDQRDGLQEDLHAANETIQLNEEIFAELSRRNIEAQTVIAGLTAVPDIRGLVVTVQPAENLVILNVGSNQGVRKNFEFTIYRDDKFVAKVIVFDTEDDLSAARIVSRKLSIERGDQAATRL